VLDINNMNEKIHPTHLKITKQIGMILGIMIFATLILGFYSQNLLTIPLLPQICGLIFSASLIMLMLWVWFRITCCKCPLCKKFIFRSYRREFKKPRKFMCRKCDVVWNTKVIVEHD